MEEKMIAIAEPFEGLHPANGKTVTVVGIEAAKIQPRFVIVVEDEDCYLPELVDYVDRPRPS